MFLQSLLHSPRVLLSCYKRWLNKVSNLRRSIDGSVATAVKNFNFRTCQWTHMDDYDVTDNEYSEYAWKPPWLSTYKVFLTTSMYVVYMTWLVYLSSLNSSHILLVHPSSTVMWLPVVQWFPIPNLFEPWRCPNQAKVGSDYVSISLPSIFCSDRS